jgi:hypothetical protein
LKIDELNEIYYGKVGGRILLIAGFDVVILPREQKFTNKCTSFAHGGIQWITFLTTGTKSV